MKKIGFIGGGNMAEALVSGLIARKLMRPSEIIVSDIAPQRRRKLARALKVATTDSNLAVLEAARAIVLAVKPQQIESVLAEIRGAGRGKAAAGRLFISIAAGVTLARIRAALGPRARVIRVMPNAPAMVGQGMAALVKSAGASNADAKFALKIFGAVGDAVALRDEKMLDAVTALSGSGPAYVYLFVKALRAAAVDEGIPAELASRMALKTLRGAEEVMRTSGRDPAELIRVVASPGGTTEAALRRFALGGFSDMVSAALHAAADRSRELGRQS
jgi:pyrroline-5-carboxylate reductase